MTSKFSRYHIYFLFTLLCIIGGTTWAFQKTGLQGSLPFWSAGMRFLIASLLIASYLFIRKQFAFSKGVLIISVLNGLMYFSIPFGSVYWASLYLPSGMISILAANISVFALLVNRVFRGTPASKGQKIGVVLSLFGIIYVFGHQLFIKVNAMELIAMAIVLVAMFGSAFITVQVQQKIKTLPILTFNSLSMFSGGTILLLSSLILEDGNRSFSGISLFSLLYLAVVGSVLGFWINVYLLKHWHISKATAHLFISPVLALYVGFLFLNETLHQNVYLGTAFVLAGVILINLKKNGRSSPVERTKQTSSNYLSK